MSRCIPASPSHCSATIGVDVGGLVGPPAGGDVGLNL